MSLLPSKRDDVGWTYHIENIPSYPKRPAISRSGSSSTMLPSSARAVVRKRAGERPRPEQRSNNFVSASPIPASSPSSSVVEVIRTPETAATTTPFNGSMENNMKQSCKYQAQSDDEVDGSMILVKKAEYVIKVKKPTGQQHVDLGSKAISAKDEDCEHVHEETISEERGRKEKEMDKRGKRQQKHHSSESALYGLMGAMKLESQLLLLRRELQLYQVFNDACGDLFIQTMHDQFINRIDMRMYGISDVARLLQSWTHQCGSDDAAQYLDDHLDTARMVNRVWKPFYEWIMNVSYNAVTHRREVEEVSVVNLQRRRKKSLATVAKLLWLVGEVEMREGVKGVLDMQDGLQEQWKEDGQVGREEAEGLSSE